MDTCTVEVGLLRKKPCGNPGLTHCANCEMPLCKDHAIAQVNSMNHKTGKFMCKECNVAAKDYAKSQEQAAKAAGGAKPAAAPAASAPPKAAAPAPKPAAPAAAKPAAPAAAKKEPPKEEKKPDDNAPLEFTPSKPKK